MKNRLFIVLDGLDGSGKSEMARRLASYFMNLDKRIHVLLTREPTYGKHGKEIRTMLAADKETDSNKEKLAELFVKDREDHVERLIRPFVESQTEDDIHVVICDRYYYSTIAFQTVQGLKTSELIAANKKFPKPDLALIINVTPQTAIGRMGNRVREKFEQETFMTALQKQFLELPMIMDDTIEIIDGEQDQNKVFSQIQQKIETVLG